MKRVLFRPQMIVVLILGVALAGCVGGPSAPTQFYMLSPLSQPDAGAPMKTTKRPFLIGIETVKLPEYLNRPQIVSNLDNTEFDLQEFNQWVEPLSNNMTRVIGANLSNLLSSEPVDIFSTEDNLDFDYIVSVRVMRLDGRLGDKVTLNARWSIFERDENGDDRLLMLRKSEYQAMPGEGTYKGFVYAQSVVVNQLSEDIAAELKKTISR